MYGLVLEGGGARGAYHIGAYKALIEEGIVVRGVAGTSVGALNGAMIAQDDFQKAYEIWNEMSYSKVIKTREDDTSTFSGRMKEVLTDRGLDITPLKNLLVELVDENKIRNSGKDFGIVTVSLTDFKPLEIYIEDIPEGKLVEYIMASAYLPVFKKEKINGKKFIDGGVYNNLPVNLLVDKGYKDLILIRTHAMGIVKKMDLQDLNTIIISPKEDLGRVLDFDGDNARNNLKLGYFDGLKALRGLKGINYYIEFNRDEDYFMDYLLNLEGDQILELGKVVKVASLSNRRSLFEFILPKISSLLGIDKEGDYGDLFLTLLEKLAEIYEVEKFNIYTYDKLLDLVKLKLSLEVDEKMGVIDKIVEKVDILSLFTKEEIIKDIGRILILGK